MTIKFNPDLTPREIILTGAFGGNYFAGDLDRLELDKWFENIDARLYASEKYSLKTNKFKVRSGSSLEYWQKSGWIHDEDPKGWFEWYCKYYIGRRHEDDIRQIKRWLAFCGPKGRFRNAIYNKIFKSGLKIENSKDISPRIQQSLLHWSYIVNNQDYESWKLEKQK